MPQRLSQKERKEKFFFLTGTAPYDADDKFQTLVTRVEAILAVENVQWAESTAAKKKTGGAGAALLPAQGSSESASSS